MPEYLAPGVYIEETSFRNKTIEGVSTSTAGFVGPCRFGPTNGLPELLTSFADFERIYGSLDALDLIDPVDRSNHEETNFLAHGVRGFFDNGGKRLYVSRTYVAPGTSSRSTFSVPSGHSSSHLADGSPPKNEVLLVGRYPGTGGNIKVTFGFRRGQNVLTIPIPPSTEPRRLRGVAQYDLVAVFSSGAQPQEGHPTGGANVYRARKPTGATQWGFYDDHDNLITTADEGSITSVHVIVLSVQVEFPPPVPRPETSRVEVWANLAFDRNHERALQKFFDPDPATRLAALHVPFYILSQSVGPPSDELGPIALLDVLASQPLVLGPGDLWLTTATLEHGLDGVRPIPANYEGKDTDPMRKTGLKAFEDIVDISIVAAPGSSFNAEVPAAAIAGELIKHCEQMRYRIAVLDARAQQDLGSVRGYRARFDSTHAALYYPWVTIIDPTTNDELDLPPSGFVAGIYARNDIEKGVHKAPANEVVRDAVGFEIMLNKSQQDVLNPEGINCFRFFEGRGYRLWGARLTTSDGEWRYVNLRRYFAYLERSIERGTQWVVFENNSELLWANVRSTVEDFLFSEWQSGHLMGVKSDEAYFVRCDRSTMTQNDIDSGRLICLVGVAPMRPAEFVIFRIGQWTGSTRQQ